MRRRFLAFIVLVTLAIAGCGSTDDSAQPAGPAPTGAPARAAGVPTSSSSSMLDFSAKTLDGAGFEGASLQGKPTMLWFWAPWCPTCLRQAPAVRDVIAAHSGDVNLVGVAGLDSAENMPEFVRLAKISAMTNLSDEAGEVWRKFGVKEQSTFVLLDAKGEVVFSGKLAPDDIAPRIDALVA